MDAGNQRDEQAGTGESTQAWAPETDDTGWGSPAGSLAEPDPPRRRPVVGAPASNGLEPPDRFERSGWNRDPAGWRSPEAEEPGSAWPAATGAGGADGAPPGGWQGNPDLGARSPGLAEQAGPAPSGAGWPSGGNGSFWAGWEAGANGWQPAPMGEPEPGAFDPPPADPLAANPDRTDLLPPVDPEGNARPVGAFFDPDGAYAPEAPYGASGGSEPLGFPSVWGASSYEAGSAYQFGGDEQGRRQPFSRIQPPIFPTDPDMEPDSRGPHRRIGLIAAGVFGALVLIGGGVAAALSLEGPHVSPAASLAPTSVPSRSAHAATATTAAGAHNVPATTPPPATSAPSTTTPATAPTTTPPTTNATLTLSTWTSQELDLILQIKSDLTTLNRDLHGQPDFSILTIDATDLQQDLQAAQSAPKPADTSVDQEWSQLLRDLGASNNDLDGAIQSQDPNLAQDLQQPVATTDTDYNTLSKTLNHDVRQGSFTPAGGAGGHGHGARSSV